MKVFLLIFIFPLISVCMFGQQFFKARSNQGYVDITKGPSKPPRLEILPGSLRFSDFDGNQMIDADEQADILFELKNTGMGLGFNITAVLEEKNGVKGLIFLSSNSIGSLQPGAMLTVDIPVAGNMNIVYGMAAFSITIKDASGLSVDPVVIEVPTRVFLSPLVKVVGEKVSSQSDNTIQQSKPFTVQILLQNTGKGLAENITVSLPLPANMFCLSDNTVVTILRLLPGESELIEYTLITNNNYDLNDIRLDFQLKEKFNRYAENKLIIINMNQPVSSEKIVIEGRKDEGKK